jgi:hypothetical protein
MFALAKLAPLQIVKSTSPFAKYTQIQIAAQAVSLKLVAGREGQHNLKAPKRDESRLGAGLVKTFFRRRRG